MKKAEQERCTTDQQLPETVAVRRGPKGGSPWHCPGEDVHFQGRLPTQGDPARPRACGQCCHRSSWRCVDPEAASLFFFFTRTDLGIHIHSWVIMAAKLCPQIVTSLFIDAILMPGYCSSLHTNLPFNYSPGSFFLHQMAPRQEEKDPSRVRFSQGLMSMCVNTIYFLI